MKKRQILYSLDQLSMNSRIALYGSGIISSLFKTLLDKERCDLNVVYLVNTFSSGSKDGLDVIKLDDLNKELHPYDYLVVTSTLWGEIEDELIAREVEHIVLSNAMIHKLYNSLLCLGDFHFETKHRREIQKRLEEVSTYFKDEFDSNAYNVLAGLRLGHDEDESLSFFKEAIKRGKNIYTDHLDKKRGGVIIEGGVADGADSVNFYKYFGKNCDVKIFGFEPFIGEFNNSPHKTFLHERGMKIFPHALWNVNEMLAFTVDPISPGASCVSRDSISLQKNIGVKGVTIDSFVNDNALDSVDLIKLDIEGSEIEALNGARETIKRFKPQLAISLYHKKEHLYEIPELCKSIHDDYRFKLGFYCPTFLDTVLYVLP